ncbi:MAG: TlpA family protein disulfide reductase [Candidatus Cloacimonetes bacterium]|nr:TlpA family protein disulfide reductase [Candidatus Cloacimonadota bacterium]
MKFLVYLSILFSLISSSFCAKIGFITGSQSSEDFKIIQKYLSKQKIKTKVFDLSKIKTLPYNEVFSYKKHAVIRLIEKDVRASYMTLEESDFWLDYLSSGGSLILIANHLGNQEIYKSPLLEYVGFSSKKPGSTSLNLHGKAKDLVADGMQIPLAQQHLDDIILPHKKSGVEGIFFSDNNQVVAMKQQSCAFRMTYFTFLPSWIKDQKQQQKLLENTIDWNLGFSLGLGTKAPDFPVVNLDGQNSGLYNQFSKIPDDHIIVMEFFATWCSSCEEQLPRMIALYNKYKNKKVSFFFINYRETPQIVKNYLSKHPEISWPVSITPNGLGAKRYGVKALPATFILDTNRRVQYIHKVVTPQKILDQEISTLLKVESFNQLHKNH